MLKGAFQTSREIFENPIWQDVVKFRIFFYIVGNAVYLDEGITVHGIKVGRGQYLRSYRNLANDLHYIENRSIKKYSLSVISKKIDQLVKEERLKIEDTELGTLFTVVNYAEYQGFQRYKKESENGERTEKEQCENGVRTEKERRENNNNKDKKDNKDKNIKPSSRNKNYSEDSVEYKMALYLHTKIMEHANKSGVAHLVEKANLQKWADDCRKLLEIDKIDKALIRDVIDWTTSHSFWKSNILSASKLREKFQELAIKMNSTKPKQEADRLGFINDL